MKQSTVLLTFAAMSVLAFVSVFTVISSVPTFIAAVIIFATVTASLLGKFEYSELNPAEKQSVPSPYN
jgi:hypothetical protein